MRVLVCGGRFFSDFRLLLARLDELHSAYGITCIIEGEAPGADQMARRWAEYRGVPFEAYRADWRRYGRREAGPIRNQRMLDEGKPEYGVAFPGGTGTADMVRRMKNINIPVWEILS